jgi:hypothetical protein
MTADPNGTIQELDATERDRVCARELASVGYCIAEDVLPGKFVASLGEELFEKHHLDQRIAELGLQVGDRRFMVPVELSGLFADPSIYANSRVMAIAEAALGGDFILESFGVVVSLPGAAAQHSHRDGTALFSGPMAGLIPAYALTVALPLIEMNEVHGTTALWPGSHRYRAETAEANPVKPNVRAGSCAIWDYRLLHGGTPNVSNAVRPLVYGTYSMPWWRDSDNFHNGAQNRLNLPDGFLATVPTERRHLFSHVELGNLKGV